MMLRIDQARPVDVVAEPLQRQVSALLDRSPRVADALHGRFLQHPAHPAIVAVPLGAFAVSSIVDALSLVGLARGGLRRSADVACAVGVAASGIAATTGLADWARAGGGEARRVGLVHAGLNLTVSAVMARSLLRGGSSRHPVAVPLQRLAGFSVSMVAGWLGGELAYRYRIGVDHADRTTAVDWTDVELPAALAADASTRVEVHGVPVLLWRDAAGELHAIGARCGHLGGPLDEGCISGGAVTCPWHGSRFALAGGELLRGPATRAQPAYDVRELADRVQLRPRS
jgi:nitrite reductase/ring-hydroxylating ferredoxin subunit/uncharacterized membrane protein